MSDASPAKADDGRDSITSSKDEHEHEHEHEQEHDEHDGSGNARAGGPAIKDKRCAYCNQAFTSSSLGRHLDQYLYKKKPDGIHNVEEIRRLRSGITRRTARSSLKQASPESPSVHDPHSAAPLQLNPRSNSSTFRVVLNQPSWQVTGVINDLPSAPSPVTQYKPLPNTLENRLTNSAPAESARALDLALREVLDSIKAAASNHPTPRTSPFEFDLQSQTFPALCLQALPHPPSLFSTHPFASNISFPLEPPNVNQREIVQQALRGQIQQWKSEQLATVTSPAQGSSISGVPFQSNSARADADMVERVARQHEEMILRHLDLALGHWMDISPASQRELWHLEVTRSFVREVEKRKKVEDQLWRTQQEANQLRAQIEKLASCQWPREFALFPPNTLPISPEIARELGKSDSKINTIDSSRWDYENLVSKWRRVVMHDKSMGRSGQITGSLPDQPNSQSTAETLPSHNSVGSSFQYQAKGSSPFQQSNQAPPIPSPKSHQSFPPRPPQQPLLPQQNQHQHHQPHPHQHQHQHQQQQQQQQPPLHPHRPTNHSPPHENREFSESNDQFRPPKRPRPADIPPGKFTHPIDTSSKHNWHSSGVHESSAGGPPTRGRSNSVLSPTLPGGPIFPLNSTAPPTPPATANVLHSAVDTGYRDRSSISSAQLDIAGNDKGSNMSPRMRYPSVQESSVRETSNIAHTRHGGDGTNTNTNIKMPSLGPRAISTEQQDSQVPHLFSLPRKPSQDIFTESRGSHGTDGILVSGSMYTSRTQAYPP
ncbi:hypothetical protein FQN57_001381 [Myotisia sp. PD_48]|nr:hypothetical protein FQN57_001381 [Myotisia sp. PD_48]